MNPEILGTIAMITSLVFMAMGLPVQIWKIHRARSTKGVSLFTTCTLFVTCTAWCVYSLTISNWYIFISNSPGAAFALVLLCQFWVFRQNKEALQGFRVSNGEMNLLKERGDIWLNRNLLRPPTNGERMQVSSDKDTAVVSVLEFFVVGNSECGNYRIRVREKR